MAAIAALIRSAVLAATTLGLLMNRLTVAAETPAWAATSSSVGFLAGSATNRKLSPGRFIAPR